jgi:RNA polymerase sigma factor (sigma-70 family)
MIAGISLNRLQDAEVIERVLNDEVPLYEIVIRRYNPYLYKIGRSYGYSHHDVEDLMQETFIKAYQNLAKLENKRFFKTWLTRIMINECYTKQQRAAFKKEMIAGTFLPDKTIPMFTNNDRTNTERAVGNKELNNIIEKAIRNIPVDYRMVFCLREMNGMSTNETSKALQITETNVKARLNRAKAMLRKEIEKMYTPEEIFQFNLVYCDKIVLDVMNAITS